MQEAPSQNLSPAQRALYELRSLRARLEAHERAATEPIAIVGVGMRFPGSASDAASYWRMLDQGVDAICSVPSDRWDIERFYHPDPETPGKMYVRGGGFLDAVDAFDAGFFGISPREAVLMDPQQRLLLEVVWEALENAGQDPAGLAGSATGVFVGISNSDHMRAAFRETGITDIYLATGSNYSVAAGRISFCLGLNGPSLAVDTACSGSLVGLHLACQSLRKEECRLALAGGVNVMLSPEMTINFCKSRMLAADGRCKTFDHRADGYVRSEGCGIVVLKRLSDALADGDNILALIRGSAVNQDGRSSGLTAPNGPAQEAVIRQALANARVAPADIDYVEAHGTGTPLGDPIEAHALAAALGTGRGASRPLVVGSVKTNIGHLESAAGIAGLIKVVLSMVNERIPPHLHFEQLNPHIDWKGVPVEIPTRGREWKRGAKPRLAGVSSFGFSGTNAHIIVEEAPLSVPTPARRERGVYVLGLSARSEKALSDLAVRFREHLEAERPDLAGICYTATAGRAQLPGRAVYVGGSHEELVARLRDGEAIRGNGSSAPEVAFLFTGQGAQYVGMGRELYQSEPVFRQALDECAAAVAGELEPGLLEVLYGEATEVLNDTRYTQPALFALQYGLAQLWRSWGVEPAVVLGHSVGEYAAACVAGIYPVEQGMRLITLRGRLTGSLAAGEGAMAAILAPEAEVREAVAAESRWVAIAASNGPESVVISGRLQEVDRISERFLSEGRRVERLRVSHAFHSPLMNEVAGEFAQAAARLEYGEPRVMQISTVTGGVLSRSDAAQSGHWQQQVCGTVRFHEAMRVLEAQGCGTFVEIGPGSTLLGMGQELMGKDDQLWAPSIRRSKPDHQQMAETLSELWARGVAVNWKAYQAGSRRVPLPTYPFERQRYWLDAPAVQPVDPEVSWNAIRESARRQSNQARLDLDVASYPQRWEILDRLSGAYIRSTLHELNAFRRPGEQHTAASLQATCGIGDSYRRLLSRWLNRLAADGTLERINDSYRIRGTLAPVDTRSLVSAAERVFASDRILLDYVTSCGSQLTGVITGRVSPLETLFPGGESTLAEDIYERAPLSDYFIAIIRAALEAIVRVSRRSGLRVIELGAGTGATAASLIPVVAEAGGEYHFTDVSDLFLRHGACKFAASLPVRFGILDLERPPEQSGYQSGAFDGVIATNVLHATRNLDETLRRVRSLLAPGGHLLLNEVTTYLPWFDITTALIEGWQLFEDHWRTDHPLISAADWQDALDKAGFERIAVFPETGSPALALGQHVFIAKAPGVQSERSAALTAGPVAVSTHTPLAVQESSWTARLEHAASESERREILTDLAGTEIAAVLRLRSLQELDHRKRLVDLGLDSLMAVELRNRLGKALQISSPLPATLVFDYPNIEALAGYLYGAVCGSQNGRQNIEPCAPGQLEQELESMSDEEAEGLLLEKLKVLQAK